LPQTQGYDETIELDGHRWRHFKSGTWMLVGLLPFVCACEHKVIRALWISPARDYVVSDRIAFPIFVVLPFVIAAWSARSVIRIFRAGEMTRKTAELVASVISTLIFFTYLAISGLTKIAF
jgi:hypothetical protein